MTAAELRAVERLHAEGCSCVVAAADGAEHLFRRRGVLDLHRLLREEPDTLRGAFVADKVVGKAAAALLILGGVRGIYAGVASEPAAALLRACGVPAECGRIVPHIINRAGTGPCPLETRCLELRTPEECLLRIEQFLESLSVNH